MINLIIILIDYFMLGYYLLNTNLKLNRNIFFFNLKSLDVLCYFIKDDRPSQTAS